ncbi:MAG: M20/M25/M40 family metallo-hydrolase [Dehalococcoidia bacterium]
MGTQEEPALIIGHNLPSFRVLGLSITLVFLLAACGGGSGTETPTPSISPSPSPSPAPTASPTPSPEGIGEPVFDAVRAVEHIDVLAAQIGSRAAGSPNELRGAEYIRDQLASYGYAVELQPFSIDEFVKGVASVRTTGASGRDIPALAFSGSAEGGVEAEIVVAGLGYPQQFPVNTDGRIALIQRGEIFFREKVANAQQAGASAVIIYNKEPGLFDGQVDSASVPVVAISLEDGEALKSAVKDGQVIVALSVEVDASGTKSHNVVAKPPGGKCLVIVGGHHDSVVAGPGANDNGSGTAVAIEMARAMAADGQYEDVCFVLFGAEEIGFVGSFYYLESLTSEERSSIEAMLNFDMLAVGDAWPLGGSTELVNIAGEVAEANDIPYTIEALPEGLGSDHAPFIDAGIPAIIINCFCDPNYHTVQDRAEFVKEERLAQAGALGMGMVERLLAPTGYS